MRGCLPGCLVGLLFIFLCLAGTEAIIHMPAIVWGDWLVLFGASLSLSLGWGIGRVLTRR